MPLSGFLKRFTVNCRTFASVALTFAVLALGIPALFKVGVLFIIWCVCLFPFSRADVMTFVMVNVLFVAMDILVISQGLFRFSEADWMGLPYWELFMWGYFALVISRLFPVAGNLTAKAQGAYALSMLSFLFLHNQTYLSIYSIIYVIVLLAVVGPAAYRVALFSAVYGIIFEKIGTLTGQWSYTEPNPMLGMPLWGIPMWIGSGVLLAFFIRPLICKATSKLS